MRADGASAPIARPTPAPDEAHAVRKKHLAALARAGFSYDIARKVLESDTN